MKARRPDPATYPFPATIVPATFLDRPTRFTADIQIEGQHSTAHINSSGRMQELLLPGRTIGVSRAANPDRRSPWDLKLVRIAGRWMSIDSALPNKLVGHWFSHHVLSEFTGYQTVRREVTLGGSRFDFVLTGGSQDCVVEVKSVTLNVGDWGVFPDAPSERGARHVRELAALARAGTRTAVIWIMAHPKMTRCWANPLTDPDFTEAVENARDTGVKLLAYNVRVTRQAATLIGPCPVQTIAAAGLDALQQHIATYQTRPLNYTASERPRRHR